MSGPVSAERLLLPPQHAQLSAPWRGSVSVRERRRPSTPPYSKTNTGCLDRALLTFDLIPGEQTQRHHAMKTQAVRGGRRWFVGKRKVLQPGHPTLNVISVSMTTKRSPSSICCCKDSCLASQNKSSTVNHELPLKHMLISAEQPFSGLLTKPGLSLFLHQLRQVARLCS